METEPVVSQFQSMPFNPFSQHQQHYQEHQHLIMLQQNQSSIQQDEEMEADDTTCDMKYSENDMNQMNITMNSSIHQQNSTIQNNSSNQNNLQKNHEEQLRQLHQLSQQQHLQQQKFGRIETERDYLKKTTSNNASTVNGKLLDEEESYDEDDYDEEDEDDLDDFDEHLVSEMMLSAAPEVQNIIKLIVSGFSACATETLRFLVEEENLPVNSPVMVGLIDHLKTQETMLIVNCLRTQQYQQQLIKQQQLLATQLIGKQIDQKLNAQAAQINQHQQTSNQNSHLQQTQHNKKVNNNTNQQLINQQQQLLINQHKSTSNSNQQINQLPSNQVLNNQIANNQLPDNLTGSLSPNHTGPLTSSPINKPFNQINSINVDDLNHLSNFNSTLQNAFGGSQAHSNVNSQNSSAQNSQSNSPVHTPLICNFNQQRLQTNQQINSTNPFSNNNFTNNFNHGGATFFNNQSGILSSFKQPFNDSGFSE